MIDISNLTVVKNGIKILDDVSLFVGENQVVGLVGKNGTGKSMLLKTIVNIIKPNFGTVKLSSNKIAYMPQSIFVSKHLPMTVIDFMDLFSVKAPMSLLEEFGIEKTLQTQLINLSGGELQKLLFVTTIQQKADIFILDEPEQNLDLASKIIMFDHIKKLTQKSSILMVSHDVGMVFSQMDHIICLNHSIHCQGKPHELKLETLSCIFPVETIKNIIGKYHD